MGVLVSTNRPPLEMFHREETSSMDLSFQQLRTIPPRLFRDYERLLWLNVSENYLRKIPPEIARLEALHTLRAAGNELSSLPDQLTKLTALTCLDIGRNRFSNVPHPVVENRQLKELNLQNNTIAGEFAVPYSNPFNLAKLNISFNTIVSLSVPPSIPVEFLVELDISHNRLEQLPASFGHLRNLERLWAMHNGLRSLPSSFSELRNLVYVNLEANELTDVSVIFTLPRLDGAHLDDNQIQSLPPATKVESTELKDLSICNNKLTAIPPNLPFDNIQSVLLSGNEITGPESNFSSMTALTHLDLSNNKLKKAPKMPAAFSRLRLLSLYHNEIEKIDEDYFSNFQSLIELNLSDNRLSTFGAFDMKVAFYCEYLDLSGNKLTELSSQIVKLKSLLILQVARNRLKALPVEACKLPRLKILNCFDNQIKSFPPEFGAMRSIEEISVGYNSEDIALPDDLSALVKLKLLYIAGTKLTDIPPSIFSLVKLQDLYITHSKLASVAPGIQSLVNLRSLVLSGNSITRIPFLGSLPHLQELNLAYNHIEELTTDWCVEMGRVALEDLDLSHNRITSIPPAIRNLRTLLKLKLAANLLTTLPADMRQMTELRMVNLEQNPLDLASINRKLLSKCVFWPASSAPRISDVSVGLSEMRGRRLDQEDSIVTIESFVNGSSLYCVFDGHGGTQSAEHASQNFPRMVADRLLARVEPKQALNEAFTELSDQLKMMRVESGTTACVVLIYNGVIYAANCGDARAVLSERKGDSVTVTRLTYDHRPTAKDEYHRIRDLGGFFVDGRVCGSLAVTRSLGDLDTQPYVTYEPYLYEVKLTKNHDFVILACDGVWDVLTDERAVEVLHEEFDRLAALRTPASLIAGLCSVKLRDYTYMSGSGDNISAIVVPLLNYDALQQRSPANGNGNASAVMVDSL